MAKNKRGLSAVVITLVIILLSIASIALIWYVIGNIVEGGTKEIETSGKCLNTKMEVTRINCSDGPANKMCDVMLMRTGTENNPIGGVKLVFRDKISELSSPSAITVEGNIEPLVGKRASGVDTGVPNANGVNRIEATVFFLDEKTGKELMCSQTNPLDF